MKRLVVALSTLLTLAVASSVQANDIEDFFKAAFRGPRNDRSSRYRDYDRGSRSYRGRDVRSVSRHGHHDYDYDYRDRYRGRSRSNSSFQISFGINNSRPRVATVPTRPVVIVDPRPVLPAPPPLIIPEAPAPVRSYRVAPAPVRVPVLPAPTRPILVPGLPRVERPVVPVHDFDFGDIVTCRVPMFTRVKVKDRDNIHPHARHVTVAVKNPNACRHSCSCCTEPVYIDICVPPCPLRDVDVSRDGSRIELDYGDYEVDITSRNGVVTVDYDD